MTQINFLLNNPARIKNQVPAEHSSCPFFYQTSCFDVFEKNKPQEKIECVRDFFAMRTKICVENAIKDFKNNSLALTIEEIKNVPLEFFPKAKPTKLNPEKIEASALALVHMSDYEPQNGVILSQRDKFNGSRNSVHFSLNHAVAENNMGSWDDMNYAIIAPFESTVNENENGKFIEGMPDDIYTKGSVKLPHDSIIIKYNDKIPKGKIKISDSIIETSEKPHSLVPVVLEKMGFSNIEANTSLGTFNYGEQEGRSAISMMKNYLAWSDFCCENNIKPIMHSLSPGCVAEDLFEAIGTLSIENSWHNPDGFSYKDKILSDIEFVQKWQKSGYYVSYDIDKMKNIVEGANTPKEALEKLDDELKIHPTIKFAEFMPQLLDDYKEFCEEHLNALGDDEKMQSYIKNDLLCAF